MKKKIRIPTLFIASFIPFMGLSGCVSGAKVTITLNLNNCEPNQTIEINKGSTLQVEEPFKDRCKFLWWKDGDDKFDISQPIYSDLDLTAHYEYDAEELFIKRDDCEKKHGDANIRVMSYNLLSSIWNNHPHHHGYSPINDPYASGYDDGRDFQARDTIMNYLPDVVGLQECDQTSDPDNPQGDNGWYDFFNDQYDATTFPYKIINNNDRTRKVKDKDYTVFSTLMYNTNTVKPVDNTLEIVLTEPSDNNRCRWLTSCVFETIQQPIKQFIVTSTHWDLKLEDRKQQASKSAQQTLAYAQSHQNLPVITTGDYNEDDYGEAYEIFINESGYNEGKYIADTRGLVTRTYHLGDGTGNKEDTTESSANHWWYRNESTMLMRQYRADDVRTIDHLFLSPEVNCTYYEVVSQLKALYSSDHMPSYVDVII